MINLPLSFKEAMKKLLGNEYDEFLASYDNQVSAGLRLNRRRINNSLWKEMDPFSCSEIPWIDNGFFYGDEFTPSRHPFYYAGLYYLQEPSAMTPANRLPIAPDDKVLDLCSAPGGKATEIMSRLSEDGLLVANDISFSRAKGLLKNVELFGSDRTVVTSAAPDELSKVFVEYFDKILIDAPCSGEGMFRKKPSMVSDWEKFGPDYYAAMQREILPEAYKMLKPGGYMLFSTCTFAVKEDEDNVEWLLENYPDLSLVKIEDYDGFSHGITERTKDCVRIFPHKMEGEGHFLALFKKSERTDFSGNAFYRRKVLSKSAVKELKDSDMFAFFNNCDFIPELEHISYENGYVSYLNTDIPDLKGIRVLRKGLLLGTLKNGRFTPSQAFAMCLDKSSYKNVLDLPVGDERVIRYLKGESIDADSSVKKGFVLVCTEGFALGWAKSDGIRLKNKYMPGWRWQSSGM